MGRLGSGPLVIGLEPSAVLLCRFGFGAAARPAPFVSLIRLPLVFFCCFFPSWPARRSAGGPSCLAPLRFFLT